jgi:hypothetical protein
MLLAGLAVLLPRAVWFQPEALFFMLFLSAWIGCWRLLIRNPLWLYALVGVLAGFAWLTKPSTAPLLAVFLAIGGLRFLAAVWPRVFGLGRLPSGCWSWPRDGFVASITPDEAVDVVRGEHELGLARASGAGRRIGCARTRSHRAPASRWPRMSWSAT